MENQYNMGFTIIEVSITGVLLVVLGASILGLQKIITDAQLFGFRNAESVDDATFAINQISKELRTLRNADNGSYPFVYGDDNQITFYVDYDSDTRSERIRYFLSGTTLYKGITEPTGFPVLYLSENENVRIITENVVNGSDPIFLYFNGDWPEDTTNNPLSTPASLSDVKLIKISLTINTDPDYERENYELSTSVQLRTLKNNL